MKPGLIVFIAHLCAQALRCAGTENKNSKVTCLTGRHLSSNINFFLDELQLKKPT